MKTSTRSAEAIVDRLAEAAAAIDRSSRRTGRSAKSIFTDAASESERAAAKEWSALKRDLADLAEHTDLNDLPEIKALIDKMRSSLVAFGETLDDAAETARATTQAGIANIDGYAHDAPWKTAGIAALAGIALGLMISRR